MKKTIFIASYTDVMSPEDNEIFGACYTPDAAQALLARNFCDGQRIVIGTLPSHGITASMKWNSRNATMGESLADRIAHFASYAKRSASPAVTMHSSF